MATKDVFDIYGRLFNHRPFVQGEIRHFVKEFEDKRGDREVENVFKVLEKVTELRDCEVDKEQALESSRQAREKEWSNFIQDIQNKCEKIDDAYRKKEQDLRQHYSKLEQLMEDKQ